MHYQEAFTQALNIYGVGILAEGFRLRALLSDSLRNSLGDLALLNAYYELDHPTPVFLAVQGKSLLEAKEEIKKRIGVADKRFSVSQYILSVEPMLAHLFPNEYVPFQREEQTGLAKREKKVRPNKLVVETKESPQTKKETVPSPAPKKRKTPKAANLSVAINANCKRLIVFYSDNQKASLYYGFITKSLVGRRGSSIKKGGCSIAWKNNSLSISITRKHDEVFLDLPKQTFKNLDITFRGKGLFLYGKHGAAGKTFQSSFEAEAVGLNVSAKQALLNLNADSLSGVFDTASLSGKLDVKRIQLAGEKGNVDFRLLEDRVGQCQITLKKGKIDILLCNKNGDFSFGSRNHCRRQMNGTFQVGGHSIALALTASKITVWA